jgi:hypothetical protein
VGPETPVHKITNVPVFLYSAWTNDFDAGKSITQAIGVGGPCNRCFSHQNQYIRPYKQQAH